MKQEQTELERQLFHERNAIQAKHEEKVKVAQAKLANFVTASFLQNLTSLCTVGPRFLGQACRNMKQT
jgi:hypothetical protein